MGGRGVEGVGSVHTAAGCRCGSLSPLPPLPFLPPFLLSFFSFLFRGGTDDGLVKKQKNIERIGLGSGDRAGLTAQKALGNAAATTSVYLPPSFPPFSSSPSLFFFFFFPPFFLCRRRPAESAGGDKARIDIDIV